MPDTADAGGQPFSAGRAATPAQVRKWRRYLADERAEAAVYRDLAARRAGEEREILLALAEAEGRHEDHWLTLLGARRGRPARGDARTRVLGFLARRFGSVFVLALAQRAEARSPYETEADATATMAADERIHEEVVRALAARGRRRLSGSFRAAVFGVNDGLVSNLSLVLGIGAAGVATHVVLLTGVAGLLAGALSMAAGEYVSVRSQRELLEASRPSRQAALALPHLDLDANELTLVYRARGMSQADAERHAREVLGALRRPAPRLSPPVADVPHDSAVTGLPEDDRATDLPDDAPATSLVSGGPGTAAGADEHEAVGTGATAALSSFCFFAAGALIPVVPYLFGLQGLAAVALAAGMVGVTLLGTGAAVGLLSGAPPLRRALRQLAIGYGAAAVTYLLGLALGGVVG
ncbi:MAG TPA: VIT1/CCC1 family protein [Microbacteriaceae bacterium]|nr:VIT1/CCC1 family protein [Microbacteriaceae bacterium]